MSPLVCPPSPTALVRHAQLLSERQSSGLDQDPAASLRAHRNLAALYVDSHRQPDEQLTRQDMANLPLLVAAENARNPGLNLHHCDSREAFIAHLGAIAKDSERTGCYRGRAVVCVDQGWLHHAAADIYHQPGQPVSVIMPDSFMVSADLREMIESEMRQAGVACCVGADGTTIQKSTNDCVMFSLSFALKMQDHEVFFDKRHQQQLRDDTARWSMREHPVPAAFYKHAHSRRTLELATEKTASFETEIVNKRGETLDARRARHVGDFSVSGQQETRAYSNSIELKRLVFIDRALARTQARQDEQFEAD